MANLSNDILNKLTPSAKEALTKSIEDIQNQILEKANSIAEKKATSEKEISLRDILEAKESILKMKMETDKLEYRRKRFTTLLTMGGALYTIIGLIIYLFQNKKFSVQTDLGLIVALVGVLTIFMGFFYTQLLQKRSDYLRTSDDYEEKLFDYEIIQRWQIIENLGSKIMLKKGYNEKESKAIYGILNLLSEELIDENKAKDIKQLLAIRNKVLHEAYHLTKTERNRYIKMADDIIGILEQAEKNTIANIGIANSRAGH